MINILGRIHCVVQCTREAVHAHLGQMILDASMFLLMFRSFLGEGYVRDNISNAVDRMSIGSRSLWIIPNAERKLSLFIGTSSPSLILVW